MITNEEAKDLNAFKSKSEHLKQFLKENDIEFVEIKVLADHPNLSHSFFDFNIAPKAKK